uniref:DUF1566 domain-containing protein n=1 Tax=viral metagenome TaxID=1070528 RepID=A0A6M3IXU4_9ZZZZ
MSMQWTGNIIGSMTHPKAVELKNEINHKKNFDGHKDWRLPTDKELFSLLNIKPKGRYWTCGGSIVEYSSDGWKYIPFHDILLCRVTLVRGGKP